MLRSTGRNCAAGLVAALALAALPAAVEAAAARNAGQPIGSLSAKLLQKPFNTLTATQQNQVICDPVEPIFGATSLYYDFDHYGEFGFTRVSLSEVEPGPGYEITSGLVRVLDTAAGVPSFSQDGPVTFAEFNGPFVYQTLDDFFADQNSGEPRYRETGYVRIEFNKIGDTGRIDDREGLEVIDSDNLPEDDDGSVDTHDFLFDFISEAFNFDNIEYEHFANDGTLRDGSKSPGTDSLTAIDEEGDEFTVRNRPRQDPAIDAAVVNTPEPGSLAVLAVGALALLRRRRRQG